MWLLVPPSGQFGYVSPCKNTAENMKPRTRPKLKI